MDIDTLMGQHLNMWSVDLEGDVFDDSNKNMNLDDIEMMANEMASQAAKVLKAVAKLRRMVAIAKEA